VAWALDELGNNTPITPHEVLNANDDHATLCPDGQVFTSEKEWDSLDKWLDEQKAKVQHGKLR
jgi:hypothetical protein